MLIRLSQPSGLAAQLEDVKQDLRVSTDDDDDKITRLIRQETDRYQDFTGRILLPTDYEWRTDSWKEPISLPVYPIREVTEVAYLDGSEAEQVLDPGDWYLVSTTSGAEIRFTDAFSSPALSERLNEPVRVRFSAGYDDMTLTGSGDDPELVPNERDSGVVTLMVGWLYDRDEPMSDELLRRMAGTRRIFR